MPSRWRYSSVSCTTSDYDADLKLPIEAHGDPGCATFINQQGFLPYGVCFSDVEPPKSVLFRDAANARIRIEELSDGFRSILSLILDLLRHLEVACRGGQTQMFNESGSCVVAPGVVLIDEVDAHLHPTWQRYIGDFFVRAFPNVQFIVTTHSPLVCRSAGKGSIFVLPRHGEGGGGRFLLNHEKARLIDGDVLEALGTGVFGDVEQSETGVRKRERLAALNGKEIEVGLSEDEEHERATLRAELPSGARSSH
jgi:hypothetical protein